MTVQWERVHVFISSTFNDMHAERDYLVKWVLPDLQDWCAQRKLKLVDIDLRWGVTEEDATSNANVVNTCLKRIDDCRPFFICLLGQRYGWIPKKADISPETFEDYPDLEPAVQQGTSVTELEILYALEYTFHGSHAGKERREHKSSAQHTFFYLRNDDYLKELPKEPLQLQRIYTDEAEEDEKIRISLRKKLRHLRQETIPKSGRPLRHYQARWDAQQRTPEIALPLACPALLEVNVSRWQEAWEKALGLKFQLPGREIGANLTDDAIAYNQQLTAGRLVGFKVDGKPLYQVVLADLKKAIARQYPGHMIIEKEHDLQRELDQHEEFLFASSNGFIERQEDFTELNDYVLGDSRRIFALTAEGGMGKSTLLANWVSRCRTDPDNFPETTFHIRFIGQSDGSTTVPRLLHYLLRELQDAGKIPVAEIPTDPHELRSYWHEQFVKIRKCDKTVFVIDALNQLETGLKDLAWLPSFELPEKVKLVLSFRSEGEDAAASYERLFHDSNVWLSTIPPFNKLEDRRQLVKAYLSQYLKEMDPEHMKQLIKARGAHNPLFLKVVLSELRVFGSFQQLRDKIENDFGSTPVSAFKAVLKRLEQDPIYTPVAPGDGVPLLFGLLLHARHGLSVPELSKLLSKNLPNVQKNQAEEAVRLFLRQVRGFLGQRENRYTFFYESFQLAAQEKYVTVDPKKTPSARQVTGWHGLLADFFAEQPLYLEEEQTKKANRRKLAELPYHQVHACQWSNMQSTLTDFKFTQAKVSALGPQPLVEDYELAEYNDANVSGLMVIKDALKLSAHILDGEPSQLGSQLSGRLLYMDQEPVCTLLKGTKFLECSWFRPLKVSLMQPGGVLLRTLVGHRSSISAVGFSENGKFIVSRSGDGTMRIWNFDSGDAVKVIENKKTAELEWQRALPNGALSEDPAQRKKIRFSYNTIEVEEIKGASQVVALHGHTRKVTTHAFSPDGKWLITGGEDFTVRVWDMEIGRADFSIDHPGGVTAVAAAPNGKLVASGGVDGRLCLWNLNSGTVPVMLSGHMGRLNAIAFTPDSQEVVTASHDGAIKVWSLGNDIGCFTLSGHSGPVTALVMAPDGRRALSASSDKTLIAWDLQERKTCCNVRGPQSMDPPIAISPDGQLAVAGYRDQVLRVWDLDRATRICTCIGHLNTINCISFTPDGQFIVSGGSDNTIRIWDASTGYLCGALTGHWDSVRALAFPATDQVVSISEDDTVRVWDLRSRKELHRLGGRQVKPTRLSLPPAALRTGVSPQATAAVVAVPKGNRLLSFCVNDDTLRLWDLEHGQQIAAFTGDCVLACCAVTQNNDIVAGTLDGQVHLLRFEGGNIKSGY